MCEAISTMTTAQMFWTSMAVTAASTAANFAAQSEQANQQAAYQRKVAEEQARVQAAAQTAANKEFVEQAAAQNIQLDQRATSYAAQAENVQEQREQRVGTALASSENAGLSLDSLMADFYRSEAKYKSALSQQYGMDVIQRDITVQSLHDKAANRAATIPQYIPSPVNGPSALGSALQLGAGALTNYYMWSDKVYGDPANPSKVTGRRIGG